MAKQLSMLDDAPATNEGDDSLTLTAAEAIRRRLAEDAYNMGILRATYQRKRAEIMASGDSYRIANLLEHDRREAERTMQ